MMTTRKDATYVRPREKETKNEREYELETNKKTLRPKLEGLDTDRKSRNK